MDGCFIVMANNQHWCRGKSIEAAKIGADAKRGVKYVLFECSDPEAGVDGIGCIFAAEGSKVENLGMFESLGLKRDDDKPLDARAKLRGVV